jgi:dienelactone hydrolase
LKKRVVIVAIVAVVVLLLASCSAIRCVFTAHKTHKMNADEVTPEQAGWPEIAPVDGMKVYAKGEPAHPPVILLHELPGLMPETVSFADALVGKGYRVYMPLFFGRFGHRAGLRAFAVCPGPSFNCLSEKEGRVVTKLRALRDRIASDHRARNQKLGIIGMCLTGGMPLALVDENVAAVVLSQPAIPFPFFECQRRSLGASLDAAARLPVEVLAIRFTSDCMVPEERFAALRARIPADRLDTYEITTTNEHAHSVLTVEGQHPGEVSEQAKAAIEHTFRFLDDHLKPQR